MNPPAYRSRRDNWDYDDDCFGGRGKRTWPIIIGLFLILLGASSLLDELYPWINPDTLWPLFIIGIGLLIVYNAMQKR